MTSRRVRARRARLEDFRRKQLLERESQQAAARNKAKQNQLQHQQDEALWTELCIFLSGNCSAEGVFRKEFQHLLHDERIGSLVFVEYQSSLSLVLCTSGIFVPMPHKSRALYLGVYEIVIRVLGVSTPIPQGCAGPGTTLRLQSIQCVESGKKDGKKEVSYFTVSDPGFCFGNRSRTVESLQKELELFGLISIVLDSLWHINPADFSQKEKLFRDVEWPQL